LGQIFDGVITDIGEMMVEEGANNFRPLKDVTGVVVDPANSSKVYVLTQDGTLYHLNISNAKGTKSFKITDPNSTQAGLDLAIFCDMNARPKGKKFVSPTTLKKLSK
jgi:hypothetical protein